MASFQGEMIDRIEFHCSKAVEFVKAGTEDTRKALKLQREARKVGPFRSLKNPPKKLTLIFSFSLFPRKK